MKRTYKLKENQEEKETLESVELVVDIMKKDRDNVEYHSETVFYTLKQMDNEINNLTKHIEQLTADKVGLVADRSKAEAAAKKLKLKAV